MHHTPLTMVGMHRSRAWIVAQLVAALVVYFGPDCEFGYKQRISSTISAVNYILYGCKAFMPEC